jgi:iron complex transport system substrate-binding protein
MEKNKMIAIVVVVVLIAAGVGMYLAFGNTPSEYRSANTDGRLAILGNADENDYLDDADLKKIDEMIKDKKYSNMADANNDGVVDAKDKEMVQNMIDIKKYNKDKKDSEKKTMTVNYIGVDKDILSGKYPVNKIIISGTQRSLGLAIAIGAGDRVVALNDYVFQYWDENFFKAYKNLPSIGDRKTPDLEATMQISADTIYAGSVSKYAVNIPENVLGSKQVLRMVSYEDGRLAEGALMLGFFTDNDAGAQKYVKWMDDTMKAVNDKLSKVKDPAATRFYLGTPTYMYAQLDGVSTAFTNSKATNIGNIIVTSPTAAGMSTSKCMEDIEKQNPGYIIGGKYMYTQNTFDEVKAVYNGMDWSKFAITDAVKNNNIYMVNYDLPFCIHTYIACSIFFPDQFSQDDLTKMITDYLKNFTEAGDYEFKLYHFLFTPEDAKTA